MSASSPNPALAPGEIVGEKYRIGPMIGRGGMSVVYEAKHVQLGQTLAVKVLNGGVQTADRVLAEAQATARLHSEHVVRVMDVGTTSSGHGFVVMERLNGRDLSEVIRKGDPLSVADTVKLVLEACHGLAEAHAAGIVHRDIKPSNLFLAQKPDRTTTLKVLDFGLARAEATAATTARGSSRGPRIMGSPGYAAPEQLGTAHEVDQRADIWALGIVLYEAVSGHRPFEANNLQDALIAAATLPMPPLTGRDGGPVPPRFESVVRKCLEKDRESRFSSVQELAEALRSFAPPEIAHYVDLIRAVAGRNPFSGATIRAAVADGDPVTATMGAFSTDTASLEHGTASISRPPPSAGPESMQISSTQSPAPGFVVASMVTGRVAAAFFGIVLLLAGVGLVFFLVSKKPALPTSPPPSAAQALPASPTALGPLPPLAPAPAPPAVEPPPANIVDLDLPATPATAGPDKARSKRPAKPAAPKASGNPMTYR